MANYAKNLIGDWETEQYEPLRQVAQNMYQTNWNKLTSDFNNLNEQLAQNFKNARIKHNEDLLNNARNSYMRMVNAEQNLANRGLTGSGLLNNYDAMNIIQTGQENDTALAELMDANRATMQGSLDGLDTYTRNMSELSSGLSDELAGLTDAEGDNLRTYRDLLGNISESAASRASANASAKGERDIEKDEQEFYRRLGILETLNNDELDDYQKRIVLINEYDLPLLNTEKAIETYKYKTTEDKLLKAIDKKFNSKKHRKYAKELKDYTYTDLWDLMQQ